MVQLYLSDNTKDTRFSGTGQSLLPIDIRLIPSLSNTDGAMSVTIEEKRSGTTVAEGPNGFSSSYDVYLRPCSQELRDVVNVTMIESEANQITYLNCFGYLLNLS